jgi:hypothetical protein
MRQKLQHPHPMLPRESEAEVLSGKYELCILMEPPAQGIGICSLPERSTIVDGIVVRPVRGLSLSRQVSMVAVSGSGNPREVRLILGMAKAFDWRA